MKPIGIPLQMRASQAWGAMVMLLTLGAAGADWTQWRGPDRSNVSKETGLLAAWPEGGPPAVWHASGLGTGIQPVSVADGRLFTTGTVEENEMLWALDTKTGAKHWATKLGSTVRENALMRWLTQRSPTVAGDRIYLLTKTGQLHCHRTFDGRLLWRRDYPAEFGTRSHVWGYCDHPLVDGDRLICTPFGTNAFITALDRFNGAVVWQTRLEAPPVAGHAALVVSEAAGTRQYVVFHARGLTGFAAQDGRLLWDYPRPNTRVASSYSPLVQGDLIGSANGYNGGLVLLQLQREGDGITVTERYRVEQRLDPFQDNTALVGSHLYTARVVAIPSCVDFTTGRLLWEAIPSEQTGRVALTLADGHLYLRFANGSVVLAEANPERYRETGRFRIPDPVPSAGVTFPVVANGRLHLRDDDRLHSYDISADPPAAPRPPPTNVVLTITPDELESPGFTPRPPRTGRDRAPDAVFVPTPHDVVARMIELARGTSNSVWVDLGSGDGRIVIAAGRQLGCRAIGYEIDPKLVEVSRAAVVREHLESLVRIEHEDLFTRDLSEADIVTVFLYPRLMERLVPLLDKLRPGSRILSHQFEMPGVKPDRIVEIDSTETGDRHRILIWTTPLKRE